MTVITHILIALASIIFTSYVYFSPSKTKLYIAYSLVGLTIASGGYLIFSKPTHMLQACLEGLVYLTLVSVGIALANKKLVSQAAIHN